MSGEDGPAAFLAARLDEAERTVYREGSPPHGAIAWLTYLRPDGSLSYTTVAHGGGEEGPWIFNGEELPEPASVLVVYDPVRALREVEAGRVLLREYARLLERRESHESHSRAMPHRTPFTAPGWPSAYDLQREGRFLEQAIPLLEGLIKAKAAVYHDHPDYRQEWKP